MSLLPLLIGGEKYIKALIEEFHDIDKIYNKLKNQAIQLVEPNKIGFFSIIALRKEQELLNTVLVEHVLRDLEQVLKTSSPDPLYGVLETASLVQNEEFIGRILDALERYINDPVKADLLTESIATILETAISQEHVSIVEYLYKKCIDNKDRVIQIIYKEAFADNRVIEQLNKQIIRKIISDGTNGSRKEKGEEIYKSVLKAASLTGNTDFITKVLDLIEKDPEFSSDKDRQAFLQNSLITILENAISAKSVSVMECLCKKYAACSDYVINYLNQKFKDNEFDEICESILVALSNIGNKDIIVSVLDRIQVYQNVSHNEQVIRQVIQNILSNATHYSTGQEDYSLVKQVCYLCTKAGAIKVIFQEECGIFKSSIEKRIEDLEKGNKLLQSEALRECNNSYLPGIVNGLAQTAYIAYDEYTKDPKYNKRQENTDLILSLMQIRNILQFSIDVQESPCHERKGLWSEMRQTLGTFIMRKSDILLENPEPETASSQKEECDILEPV
ncbi:hypothetical protein [Wolbachia endosymbiont of Cantharis cryptica]|uniref:host RNA manipulator TomO n=1 Tax=Wolbachia endosymbiont of Cantharis cryptica TaxID=3066132 RepID=UPI00376ED29E